MRARNPKFTILQIFAMIIMDLFLTIGPLLPTFNGILPKLLIEPAAIGIGLGLISHIIFFPTSTSHTVLDGMEGLVRLLKRPLDVTVASLIDGQDSELRDLRKLKTKTIDNLKDIEPALGFLQLDFSVGRWNAGDVKSLKEPIRQASISTLSLLEFHIARLGGKEKLDKLEALTADRTGESDNNATDEKRPYEVGMRQLMESVHLVQALRSPEHQAQRLEMLEAIREPSRKILSVCQEASTLVADSIHAVNSSRWFGRRSKQQLDELCQRGQSVLETLHGLRAAFATEITERLLQTNADIFREDGMLKALDNSTMHKVRCITLGMIFEERVLGVVDSWERVLGQLIALMEARQKVRLWFPRGLRYAVDWVSRGNRVVPVNAVQSPAVDPDAVEAQSKAAQQQLRISRGYKVRQRSGLGKALLGTYHWLINAEGMYALRVVVVTIALAIPAVIPSSAGFYYRQKGLWALIMGQTTVVVYMSDFTLSLVSRGVGTVVGGVAGLVAWYIGSGRGPGNPYGLAAVMAVVIVLLMWGRIFAPLAFLQATIMGGATCILVVGYSWDDT